MKTLELRLTIGIDGDNAADIVDDLGIDVDAGELDQAALNMLRAHLCRMGDTRDWRIVTARVDVPEVDHEVMQ